MILTLNSDLKSHAKKGGGKALKLAEIAKAGAPVPEFIVVSNDFFKSYLEESSLMSAVSQDLSPKEMEEAIEQAFESAPLSSKLKEKLDQAMKEAGLTGETLAVRSSGVDEDSVDNSFAGMFSSFLFQNSLDEVELSLRRCWASAYGERAIRYRLERGLDVVNIKMGVVIQKMVNSESSGVMFTHNPIDVLDRGNIVIDSVFGQCEGLVSGALEADSYLVNRETKEFKEKIANKESQFLRSASGTGIEETKLPEEKEKTNSLTPGQIKALAEIGLSLESQFEMPLDIEWALENGKIYIVQSRPITNLPPKALFNEKINGRNPILWDNSNIVESFAGVTTPLTFSATKKAYAIVYRQTCRLMAVPERVIEDYEESFENMLGLVKGRVYYNLINWYKLLLLMPGSSSSKGFMETMMGVKEDLNDEHQKLFQFVESAPKYSLIKKAQVFARLTKNFLKIDRTVKAFSADFDQIYQKYNATRFQEKSLREIKTMYLHWEKQVTYNWKPPIINDFLCMVFFGALKSMTEKWIKTDQASVSLQNDLLCGQGDLDSALPVKTLMKIAQKIDQNDGQRSFILETDSNEAWGKLNQGEQPEIKAMISDYLHLYGFRCNNEQKLEEKDLNDDPSFLFNNLQSYLRMKNYSVDAMKERETEIRDKAQALVNSQLSGVKRKIYNWTLKHARNAVKNRENLRFLRTKAFGVSRKLFRAIGSHLAELNVIEAKEDVFFLTIDELWDFIDGKAESLKLGEISKIRKREYQENCEAIDPPDRFLTYGAAGASFKIEQVLNSGDLLKDKVRVSDDPNVLLGVSCCPGSVTGAVVVANSIEEAQGLNGEILVTKRTDPGWVPLYPSCSGLIIERGSLLSHSAVIARELGLPTIVGVSGGLMTKMKTGMKVELNATLGEVRILDEN